MTHLLPPTVSAVMRQSHTDEVTEIQDTDQFVRSLVARCIDAIALCGRTLPTPDPQTHRYAELIDCLGDALHDGMPAPREELDDPFM